MIHLLQVSPEMTLKEVRKLARRYAMTGGVEIELAENLTPAGLRALAALFKEELEATEPGSARSRASIAFRVLALVLEHPQCDTALAAELDRTLAPYRGSV